MSDVVATTTGLDEAIQAMRDFDQKMTGSVFRTASRAGAKVILDAQKASAPHRSGTTASNIRIRSQMKPSKGLYRTVTGVGVKDWSGPAFYAAFVLFGHRVGPRRLGTNRKLVAENDWMRRAAVNAGAQAAEAMSQAIVEGVEAKK